jgi:hypothetical protein
VPGEGRLRAEIVPPPCGTDIGAQRSKLARDREFLSIPGQLTAVRDRSEVTSVSLRKLEALPPKELEAAVLQVTRSGLGASADEIVVSVPRLLSFKSVGAQLRQLVSVAVARLEGMGMLAGEAGLLVAVESTQSRGAAE